MDCNMTGFPVHHQLPELAQTHVHWVSDVISPSHPLLFPSPPVFNLSLHQGLFQCIRWPKLWSLGFSINPSNECSGLISFRIDWFDLPAVQGTLTLNKSSPFDVAGVASGLSLAEMGGWTYTLNSFFPRCLQWVCNTEVKRSQLWLI